MTTDAGYGPKEFEPDTPSPARAYDFYLGGTHNFKVDRDFAEQITRLNPWTANVARLNRSFLRRAVQFCLDQGVRQFLDLGSGIPTVGNVHEIAQRTAPDARVIYVDYEPVAFRHAQSLLADNPYATIVQADLRDPGAVLGAPETRELLDFSQPVGLLIVAVLHFIGPADRPDDLVRTYREYLAPGSCLAISHFTDEHAPAEQRERVAVALAAYENAGTNVYVRTRDEMAVWFDGMDLVEPGIAYLPDWRPDSDEEAGDAAGRLGYGAVARRL